MNEPLRERLSAPVSFTPLDMLMPARLLKATDWRDNPLVVYSQRRGRRVWRFVLTRLFEIVLLALAALIVAVPFAFFQDRDALVKTLPGKALMRSTSNPVVTLPQPITAPSATMNNLNLVLLQLPAIWLAMIFLLLRYHLLINDQSNHMKNLSRERLAELLLSQLGSEEYFLHHFLMFCHRYRVLVAWGVVWGVAIGADILMGEVRWVQGGMYTWLIATLNMVLFTWVGGVVQYVTEWKWFAGGAARRWRPVLSLAFSLAVAAAIWVFTSWAIWDKTVRGITSSRLGGGFIGWSWPAKDGIYEVSMDFSQGGILVVVLMFCAAVVVTYFIGDGVYRAAAQLLAWRFDPDRPNPMPRGEG
ncbi:MAG: hypothetical protein ABFD69_06000 [Candidatus Sumerlaeia bacterium]